MPQSEHSTIVGESKVPFTLVRSRKRRRTVAMSMELDGRLVVRAPLGTSLNFVQRFVQNRAGWIARRFAEHRARPRRNFIEDLLAGEDVSLPYRGVDVPVIFDRDNSVRKAVAWRQSGVLRVVAPRHADGDDVKAALVAWYKERALELIERRVEAWVDEVGRAPSRIQVRSQKTQWGSCGEDGTLRFNWQLAMAPPSLLEYVVVHELAHLRIRHHGASFWRRMEQLMPNYESYRARLREFAHHLPL
jgi:predicted metal-dependent hydrolase